jgi:hypothetical protein
MTSRTAIKAKSPKSFSWSVATRRLASPDQDLAVALGSESGCAPSPRSGIDHASRRKAR